MATIQTRQQNNLRRTSLIATPVVLLVTMYLLFNGLVSLFGPRVGFFLGMAVYYLGWCVVFPLRAIGSSPTFSVVL